jgi:hypothetical protein
MYSTIGLQPFIAEPTAIPVNPSSAIGVSITLFLQTHSFRCFISTIIPQPLHPLSKRSSLRISSLIASQMASLNCIVLISEIVSGIEIKINILSHFFA